METVLTTQSSGAHEFDLPVTLQDTGVLVAGGPVRLRKVDYTAQEELITFPAREHATIVTGYLVLDTQTSLLELFVDEFVQDGISVEYVFERGDRYQALAHLFHFVIPPNTTDLSTLDYTRWRIIAVGE